MCKNTEKTFCHMAHCITSKQEMERAPTNITGKSGKDNITSNKFNEKT